MISALHRVPRSERRALAQEWARRSNAVQAAARMTREPDRGTVRARALDDARGTVLREGCTYRAGRVVPWQVVRSRDVVLAVAEYVNASMVNVPADRVQKAWEELRRMQRLFATACFSRTLSAAAAGRSPDVGCRDWFDDDLPNSRIQCLTTTTNA